RAAARHPRTARKTTRSSDERLNERGLRRDRRLIEHFAVAHPLRLWRSVSASGQSDCCRARAARGKANMRISLGYLAAVRAALASAPAAAQMGHDHAGHGGAAACAEPTLACAAAATPAFGPDGALWLAWASGGRVSVARSPDLGRTFGPAVAVNPQPVRLD